VQRGCETLARDGLGLEGLVLGCVIAPEASNWFSFSIWSAVDTPAAALAAASAWVMSWTSWAVTFGRVIM